GREMLAAINPDVAIKTYQTTINAENILSILTDYDLVLDGSDTFSTRYLVNDACFFAKKPLISGSIFRFEGQLTTLKPHDGFPCYRCLYAEPPPAGLVPNCQEAGVRSEERRVGRGGRGGGGTGKEGQKEKRRV